jgi:hypothetical protein
MTWLLSDGVIGGLFGGIIGGALTIVSVLVAQRSRERSQRRGEIEVVVSDFCWPGQGGNKSSKYTFYIKVFLDREVGIGFRDIDVLFMKNEKVIETDRPKDTGVSKHLTDHLNFAPQQWTVRKVEASRLEGKLECDEAWLVALLPHNSRFKIPLPLKTDQKGRKEETRVIDAETGRLLDKYRASLTARAPKR